MILHRPLKISTRLLPAVQLPNAWLSLEPEGVRENRLCWTYFLDVHPSGGESWTFTGSDLQSGVHQTDDEAGYRHAFGALLSFLEAAVESYPDGENADLFPPHVVEWADQHIDEIGLLRCEIEEADWECPGHESTDGAHMGESVYCDGSCLHS